MHLDFAWQTARFGNNDLMVTAKETILRPVIPLACAFATGLGAGLQWPGLYGAVAVLAAVSGAAVIWAIAHRRRAVLLPVVWIAALGYLTPQPWMQPRFAPNHIVHFADGRFVHLCATILAYERPRGGRQRLVLGKAVIDSKAGPYETMGRVRLTIVGDLPAMRHGDRIRCSGRLRRFRNFNNPGRFDYVRFMALQGVWCRLWSPAARVRVIGQSGRPSFQRWIGDLRQRVASRIAQTGTGSRQQVLKALLVGDRSGISAASRQQFTRVGVGHLLAISGLHVGIVAALAIWIGRIFMARLRPIVRRGWCNQAAAVLAVVPVIAYGLLAGMSPSTQRAVVMISGALMASLLTRNTEPINLVAIAALVILIAAPGTLLRVSFQLSFAAVTVIVVGFSLIGRRSAANLQSLRMRIVLRVLDMFWVALLAMMATLPLSMYYFNMASLIGPCSNLLIVPLVGFGVVPLGLFSVALLPIWPAGASLGFSAAGWLMQLALDLIGWFARLPFAAVRTFTPSGLEIGLYYAALAALGTMVASCPDRIPIPRPVPSRWDRYRLGPAAVILTVVASLAAADVCYWIGQRSGSRILRATMIDVRSGNAALIELPGGAVMLIDGGGFSDPNSFDIGARVVAPLLWRKKIMRVDVVVLSHPNSDHLNGLLAVLANFKVGQVWTNGRAADTKGYRRFVTLVRQRKIPLPSFEALPRTRFINGVRIELLHPPPVGPAGDSAWVCKDPNNNSIVLKISYGRVSFLFPGDIEALAESRLSRLHGRDLASTVLLAPHHGSDTSSTVDFLSNVRPQWVIVSCGRRHGRQSPPAGIMQRYRRMGSRVLTTDRHGAVTLTTDGRYLAVTPFFKMISDRRS